MKKDEKLHTLLSGMMEYLEKRIKALPEEGKFESHFVVMDYPGTKYEGFLRYEYDLTDDSGNGRRLVTAMAPAGTGQAVSHYLFKGTKQDCLSWLKQEGTEALLAEDYARLKESVDRLS